MERGLMRTEFVRTLLLTAIITAAIFIPLTYGSQNFSGDFSPWMQDVLGLVQLVISVLFATAGLVLLLVSTKESAAPGERLLHAVPSIVCVLSSLALFGIGGWAAPLALGGVAASMVVGAAWCLVSGRTPAGAPEIPSSSGSGAPGSTHEENA